MGGNAKINSLCRIVLWAARERPAGRIRAKITHARRKGSLYWLGKIIGHTCEVYAGDKN